jgi:hypothetical protein
MGMLMYHTQVGRYFALSSWRRGGTNPYSEHVCSFFTYHEKAYVKKYFGV